jgi:hypothetical protein
MTNDQKTNERRILDGVDDDLGDNIIYQQQHQAHYGHQATGFGNCKASRLKLKGDEG